MRYWRFISQGHAGKRYPSLKWEEFYENSAKSKRTIVTLMLHKFKISIHTVVFKKDSQSKIKCSRRKKLTAPGNRQDFWFYTKKVICIPKNSKRLSKKTYQITVW